MVDIIPKIGYSGTMMMKKEIEMVDVHSVVAREALARIIDPEAFELDLSVRARERGDSAILEQQQSEALAKADAILALITAAPKEDPNHVMVLVPREPTREMVAAGDFVLFEASQSDGDFGEDAIDTYRAMIAVAPR